MTGYFYNPNIQPYSEYARRRETLVSYSKAALLTCRFDESYPYEDHLRAALHDPDRRCISCYRQRLKKAFETAGQENFGAVTTTLLYSKYQKHEAIAVTAEELSAEYDIPFLYKDFRPGWKEGQEAARSLNLYRQNYCGCIFSEYERFTLRSFAHFPQRHRR